jgi:small-conductance mechanosensitive channel
MERCMGSSFLADLRISPWLLIPLVFLVWVIVLSMLKRMVFAIIKKVTDKTENHLDDLLMEASRFPVQLLVYASGVLVVEQLVPQTNDAQLIKYLMIGFKVTCIVAGIIFIDKFLQGMIREGMKTVEVLKAAGGVAQVFVRVLIFCIGGLILLDTFGVSITPIIASLGVGSLAVALAIQPTLENFFSGVQLIADKPIAAGQMIRLESGEEGVVERIGWRSTWIILPNNNMVVMPNKLLVNSRVINFCLPDNEVAVPISVGVNYNADLDKVERVTLEVAAEVLKTVEGGVKTFQPVARFYDLGESSINLRVVLRAQDMSSTHLVKHQFIKSLTKRYADEGIVIPYPTRTVVNEC